MPDVALTSAAVSVPLFHFISSDGRRIIREGAQEGLVDKADRRVVGDPRRGVVGEIAGAHHHLGAIRPVGIEPRQRVGDVGLGHQVTQHVAEVALVARQRSGGGAEARGDAFGELIDQASARNGRPRNG